MRRLLRVVAIVSALLIGAVGTAFAADPVKIQTKVGSNTAGNPMTTTFDNPVTAGSCVVVAIHIGDVAGTVSTVVDNKAGNTYAQAESKTQPADGDAIFVWYAYINNGGSSFSVTATPSTAGVRMDLIEVGPCDPTPLDAHNAGYNAGSTSPNSGNVTTSATRKTVGVGFLANVSAPAGLTAGAGWSGPAATEGSFRSLIWQDAIAPSTTLAATGTLSSQEWAMIIVTFKGLASSTPVRPRLLLLGVGGW